MPLRYQGKPRCISSIFTVIVIANFLLCSLRQRHFTPLFRAHRFLCGSREHSLRSCQPITEAEPPYREAPVLQTEERPKIHPPPDRLVRSVGRLPSGLSMAKISFRFQLHLVFGFKLQEAMKASFCTYSSQCQF